MQQRSARKIERVCRVTVEQTSRMTEVQSIIAPVLSTTEIEYRLSLECWIACLIFVGEIEIAAFQTSRRPVWVSIEERLNLTRLCAHLLEPSNDIVSLAIKSIDEVVYLLR